MNLRRFFCAALALLLILSSVVAAQANTTTSLPLLLPSGESVSLDNVCHTMDSFLHQIDSADVEKDYSEVLLNTYFGVQVRCKSYVNLWSEPAGGVILSRAENEDVLRLLGISDGWFKVLHDDEVAYLSADHAIFLVYDEYQEAFVRAVCEDLVAESLTWLGTPYRYGGSSRSGTDCSGFTMAVFSQFGYSLIHGAGDQYAQCTPVTDRERDVGDLVFFNWGYGISHVGIYLGGGTFIHSSTSSGVIISSLYENYYANGYVGAGRILGD